MAVNSIKQEGMKAVKFIYQETFQRVLGIKVRLFKTVFYREAADLSPVPDSSYFVVAWQIIQVLKMEEVLPIHPKVGYPQMVHPLANMISGAFQVRLT